MQLSYSQIQLYRTCPKQYEYACVKKIERQITPAESFGSSMHNALKRWGELEMHEEKEPDQQMLFAEEQSAPQDLSLAALMRIWHASFSVHGYPTKAEAQEADARGKAILERYHAWWSENRCEVIGVEKGFTMELGDGLTVSGRFDRLERIGNAIRVVDYKTSRVRSQSDIDEDLQLSVYALAVRRIFEADCGELRLLFLRPEGIVALSTFRSAAQLEDAMSILKRTDGRISVAEFDPKASIETCGRCPYRGICPASVA